MPRAIAARNVPLVPAVRHAASVALAGHSGSSNKSGSAARFAPSRSAGTSRWLSSCALAWAAVAAALAVALCVLPVSLASADEVRLGAWNIEHLGSPERRSPPARNVAQKPEDLARYIAKSRVDVLALEEIGDTDGVATTRRNATLDRTFELLSVDGASWKYVLLPKKDTTETFQLTGVAWNTARVQLVGEPFRIPVVDDPNDDVDPWQRHPHGLKFTAGAGKTDFVVIPLHMKSNVGGAATANQRAKEAQMLVDQLPAIRNHFQDEDLVLLGDANCLKATEPALQSYRDAGLRDLNAADQPTTYRGGQYDPAPFDRLLVTDQTELRASRLEVLAPATDAEHLEHKKKLSDHFLVATTITVGPDDDPR